MAFQSWYPRLSGESHLTCFGSTFLGALLVGVSLLMCQGCGLVIVSLLSCRVVDLLGFSFLLVSFLCPGCGRFLFICWLGFALVWFGLCPGCGLRLVHCFFSFCCVSVCPDVGLGLFKLFIRSFLVRAVALSLCF